MLTLTLTLTLNLNLTHVPIAITITITTTIFMVFSCILADTLGSVGVIISSLLIYFFDLTIFDALCSVFIAFLIFFTVYPLIQSTSKILLQETPSHIVSSLRSDFIECFVVCLWSDWLS
eukprot:TRINITY_DN2107_c0_g1_i1.p1 TRINITY_DN2107_c0_g1~~TRINITY_DN2107_c0_g1_i1.p1  ORF type:complete len:119 (-),score=5.13 TRINITY_DN2107_c0_g1_i1:166-522(-)